MTITKTPADDMVDRFLGWRIPKDFNPDFGITFTPPVFAGSWPTGTNLLCADQAKVMFEHCTGPTILRMQEEAANLKALVDTYSWALDEANKEIRALSTKRPWWKLW